MSLSNDLSSLQANMGQGVSFGGLVRTLSPLPATGHLSLRYTLISVEYLACEAHRVRHIWGAFFGGKRPQLFGFYNVDAHRALC